MNPFLINSAGRIFNLLFKHYAKKPPINEVLFISRQTSTAPRDFELLADKFKEHGWSVAMVTQTFNKGELIPYVKATLQQLKHMGRCKICFTDGYNPTISMLDLPSRQIDVPAGENPPAYTTCPTRPIVIQLWHAFGGYKKFAFQTLGGREGRSVEDAQTVQMHKNYSYIVCSGKDNQNVFAEAFGYPMSQVVPLGRPVQDELFRLRIEEERFMQEQHASNAKPVVLFAPTLRRSDDSSHPFIDLRQHEKLLNECGIEARWSFHPVDQLEQIGNSGLEALHGADLLVTDYSSLAYEAVALGKDVVFYTPDLEQYLQSPGLNIDPSVVCPEITCKSQTELIDFLKCWANGSLTYNADALKRFVGDTFDHPYDSVVEAIYRFSTDRLEQ